ncbi:hypothetical protein BHE74_00050711 [Ensete ventricosum]|nr:hypothetical protein GW17_00032141 [Ensete ventricosum]RWW43614.1 hypothetical protein BHE74_00050711 [Ensete ventricosum]
MVQEGEEVTRMANRRVGETGLFDSGPSTRSVADGTHGTTPQAATNFLYYRPEEEGARFTAPIRLDGSCFVTHQGKTRSATSTDICSAQHTASHLGSDSTASRKASSDQSADQEQAVMTMMIAGDGSIPGSTPTSQLASQEKVRPFDCFIKQ